MRGRAKAIKALAVVAMIISSLSVPAHAQIGQNGGAYRGPPVVEHPKIDEKAYKAALDRIPTPKKPYDPWGQVHDSEPAAKPSGKSN